MDKGVNLVNPEHFYRQIVKDIKGRIANGELKPGEKIETQAELARKYDVSLITVRNALALLVSEGLLLSRAGRGTFVLEGRSKRIDFSDHRSIGLVLRDLNHPYFSMIVRSVEERAYQLGFNVLLSNSSGNIEREENQIDKFRRMGVDGLIIASLSLEYKATEHIQRLHTENFPYVMVSYMHDPEYWYVGSDHELGGYLATEHLLQIGYRSIGYVHMGGKSLLSEVRKNGYSRALTEHGMAYDPELVFVLDSERYNFGTDRFQIGYRFGQDFGTFRKRPHALFFYNDMVALGFIQGAAEQNIRVPEDVGIVGFDDAIVGRYASVPLTSIHQPVDKIGSMAVEIIQKRIQKIEVEKRTIFKPSLVIRESCGAKKSTLNVAAGGSVPNPSL